MKNKRQFKSSHAVQRLTLAAVLTALSVVLAILAKYLFPSGGPIRFTIENLPILFGAITLGPLWAAAIGIGTDLLSCLISGMTPLPLITVGTMLIGLTAGIVYRMPCTARHQRIRLPLSVVAGHLVGSIAVKTAVLYGIFGPVALFRIPLYLLIAGIEYYLLHLLTNSRGIKRALKS